MMRRGHAGLVVVLGALLALACWLLWGHSAGQQHSLSPLPSDEAHGPTNQTTATEGQILRRTLVQSTVLVRLLDAATDTPLAGTAVGGTERQIRLTAATGEVDLPQDDAKQVWVPFSSPTHGSGRLRQPWVRAGSSGVAVYRLRSCAQVELTIVDEAGRPRSQAVELRRAYRADADPDGVEALAFRPIAALATGSAIQLALPFGIWMALVPGGDGAFEPSMLTVDEPRKRFEITLRQGSTNQIAGIAIDQRGQPAEGVAVHVPGLTAASCTTDAHGLFSIDRADLPATTYQSLDFARDGQGYAPVLAAGPFVWGSTANVVRVERRNQLVLEVRAEDGVQHDWTLRRFPAFRSGGTQLAPLPDLQYPNAAGRIDLPAASAPGDRLLIDLAAPNAASVLVLLGDLPRTTEPGDVEIRRCVLSRETEVRVELANADGLPVSGATVSAVVSPSGEYGARKGALATVDYRPDIIGWGAQPVKLLAQGSTDQNGATSLRVRIQPHLFVRAEATGYATAACSAGSGPSPIRFVLHQTGSLAGAVANLAVERGRQWSSNVLLFPRSEGIVDPVFTSQIVRGHYTFASLPDGEYEIVIHAGVQGEMQQFPMGSVQVRGATERDLDASVCLRSTVTIVPKSPDAFPMGATLMVEGKLRGRWADTAQVPVLQRATSAAAAVPAGIYRVWLRRAAANGAGEVYVLADGEFEVESGRAGSWELVFPTAGGDVVLWLADGQPAARRWFRLDSWQIVQTDDLGRLRFEVFPGRTFGLHSVAMHRGIWEDEGPVVDVEPERQRDYTLPQ